jgi:hypothetical protein
MQNNRRAMERVGWNYRFWRQAALGVAWLALFSLPWFNGRAATLSASVDKPVVVLGQTVTFSLVFDGASVGQPPLPAIPNFQIVGQGSSINMDIGRGVSQQTFTYQLAPTAVGDFTIPGLQFNAGGQVLRTQPIPIKVVQPGTAITMPGVAAPTAFVKLNLPKKQLYVGEVSEVEIQVFFQEARITQYPQLPLDPGLTAGKWLKPTESRVNISNVVYAVVSFKQPIIPVKAGLVTVGPSTASILVPDKTRQGNFFFGRPENEMRMATEQATIQVLPVPAQNMPPTYAGAVGNFTMTFSAAPTNLAAGDPITVRVKIAGRGALDAVRLPPQPDWNEFKTYPATSSIESGDPNNNSGAKNFEQVVVPERAGLKALPAFAFSFFDPDQKMFRTLNGPAIPLNVSASVGGTVAMPSLPGASNAAPAQPTSDLAHIKPHLGAASASPLLITRPWFLAVQVIPPALWLGLLVWRKRAERLANDPKARRRAEVMQKLRQGLVEMREHAAAKNSDAFFGNVTRCLQEQIGERIDLPANAITEAVVAERLRPAGAPAELCATIQTLFQRCNLARYAPVKSSEELSAVAPELEKALRGLQEWEPKKS